MILDKTKNTKRNILWGWCNKIINILMPFILRTIIIHELGIEYLGLNGLFTSILGVLSLAELGFDSAVVFVMYSAIAEDDLDKIGALQLFLRRIYYIIGTVILIIGLSIAPIIPLLIKDISSIPNDVNIFTLYICFLFNTVISYYLGGYKQGLFKAYQRVDIISNVDTVCLLIKSVLQCYFLIQTHWFYSYILINVCFTALKNLILVRKAKNSFSFIKEKGKLDIDTQKSIKKVVVGILYNKIGGVLAVTLDDIVCSKYLGIIALGLFSNYKYICNAILGFLIVIYNSMLAGLGNNVAIKSIDENKKDIERFTFIYNWICGWCFYCLLYLFQPFIYIWLGKDRMLPNIVMISIALYFYSLIFNSIICIYKEAAGIYWEDRYRGFIGGIVNFILNIIIVNIIKKYGDNYSLMGIVLSTVITQFFITVPWAINITYKLYFKSSPKSYYIIMLKSMVNIILAACISYPVFHCVKVNNEEYTISLFIIRIVLCLILPNIIMIVLYYQDNLLKESYKYVKEKLKLKKK